MEAFYLALGIFGVVLQVVVIYALTRGAYRVFPGVAFYLLVLFLTSIADLAVYLDLSGWPDWYREYYYINNIVRHLSGFAAVVSLIYTATRADSRQLAARLKIAVLALAVIAGSFLLAAGARPEFFMNRAARNLSFATVILNLILWFSLVRVRARDRRLFLVSGGLGLNMAGEAIGQSLLNLSQATVTLGNLINVFSHLLCLWIWWIAFWTVEVPGGAPLASEDH